MQVNHNQLVESLVRKMVYARAGGHEAEYQKYKEQAEYKIYREKSDARIAEILKDRGKKKREPNIDYGSPFHGWGIIEEILFVLSFSGGALSVFVMASALVAIFVIGIRCLLKH